MERKDVRVTLAKMVKSEAEAIEEYERWLLLYENNRETFVNAFTTHELDVIRSIISEEKGHILALDTLLQKYDSAIPPSMDIVRKLQYLTSEDSPLDEPSLEGNNDSH